VLLSIKRMSTEFFLADERCMSSEEIAAARAADYPDALLCRRSAGGSSPVYTLALPAISFLNLDSSLAVHGLNSPIATLGALRDEIEERAGRIVHEFEARAAFEHEFQEWSDSLRGNPHWAEILPNLNVPPASRVLHILGRLSLR
jgi:hypothetical protein